MTSHVTTERVNFNIYDFSASWRAIDQATSILTEKCAIPMLAATDGSVKDPREALFRGSWADAGKMIAFRNALNAEAAKKDGLFKLSDWDDGVPGSRIHLVVRMFESSISGRKSVLKMIREHVAACALGHPEDTLNSARAAVLLTSERNLDAEAASTLKSLCKAAGMPKAELASIQKSSLPVYEKADIEMANFRKSIFVQSIKAGDVEMAKSVIQTEGIPAELFKSVMLKIDKENCFVEDAIFNVTRLTNSPSIALECLKIIHSCLGPFDFNSRFFLKGNPFDNAMVRWRTTSSDPVALEQGRFMASCLPPEQAVSFSKASLEANPQNPYAISGFVEAEKALFNKTAETAKPRKPTRI